MITAHYNHSLANRMFQYAFARILAERFRYRLRTESLAPFPRTREEIAGEEVFGPKACWYCNWPVDDNLQAVHQEDIRNPPHSRLSLCGTFQRFELFRENHDRIREDWFRVDTIQPTRSSSDFLISLISSGDAQEGRPPGLPETDERDSHFKDTTTFGTASLLSNDEIRRLAGNVSHDRLYLLADASSREALEAEFRDLRPIVVSEGVYPDFLFMLSFQKIAFSQNAMHWWAAFLSDAKEVYFPKCDRGYWSHPSPPIFSHESPYHGIDLRVDDARFIYDW